MFKTGKGFATPCIDRPLRVGAGGTAIRVVVEIRVIRAWPLSPRHAEAIGDIRLTLNQGQPLGNSRFLNSVER